MKTIDVTTTQDEKPVTIPAPLEFTPELFDMLIVGYEGLQTDIVTLQARASEIKDDIQHLVDTHGTVPSNAKSMKRLHGATRSATLTFSTSTSINEAAVSQLQIFLESVGLGIIFAKLFERLDPPVYVPPPPRHRKVESPGLVIEKLGTPLKAKVRKMIFEIYGKCIQSKPNTPSFKIEPLKKG